MINFCVFKWKPDNLKLLPSQHVVDYVKVGADHTNRMFNMVKKHLHAKHRFICITDDSTGLDPKIKVIPIWKDASKYGGCYRRLKFFSKEMKSLIGDRIVQCDIDTIITGDITPLIDREEPLILYKHHQHLVNGGLWVMNAGVCDDVWTEFIKDPLKAIELKKNEQGTDQGWLKYYLRDNLVNGSIKTIGRNEGIYDMRCDILNGGKEKLPKNCCMVVFPGGRDPSQFTHLNWVRKYWK